MHRPYQGAAGSMTFPLKNHLYKVADNFCSGDQSYSDVDLVEPLQTDEVFEITQAKNESYHSRGGDRYSGLELKVDSYNPKLEQRKTVSNNQVIDLISDEEEEQHQDSPLNYENNFKENHEESSDEVVEVLEIKNHIKKQAPQLPPMGISPDRWRQVHYNPPKSKLDNPFAPLKVLRNEPNNRSLSKLMKCQLKQQKLEKKQQIRMRRLRLRESFSSMVFNTVLSYF